MMSKFWHWFLFMLRILLLVGGTVLAVLYAYRDNWLGSTASLMIAATGLVSIWGARHRHGAL
jgi:hypothetical protein